MIERSRVQLPAAALSGNDLGQVVHTNVPLFTKQYKLVPCEGLHVTRRYVAAIHGSNEQGEYCSSSSEAMYRMNRDINYLLYYYCCRDWTHLVRGCLPLLVNVLVSLTLLLMSLTSLLMILSTCRPHLPTKVPRPKNIWTP